MDEVAAELVGKLVGRHPHVFADGDSSVRDAVTQQHRWEELKQAEKQRRSSVDGVALGQPAAGLGGKLTQRAIRSGLPADLLPSNESAPGDALFALAAAAVRAGLEPETELRAAAHDSWLTCAPPNGRPPKPGSTRSPWTATPGAILARITFAHRLRQLSTGSRRPARSPPKSTRMDLGGAPKEWGSLFTTPNNIDLGIG